MHQVDPNHEHDHDISTEYLRARLGFWADPGADLLTLAVSDRQVLGYAFTVHNEVDDAIHVRELGVDAPYQGRKLAARILQAALDSDMYRDVPNTGLTSVTKAVGLYTRLGFQALDSGVFGGSVFLGPVEPVREGIHNYLATPMPEA